MKLSTLSYQQISDALHAPNFSMPYDASDAMRTVRDQDDFERIRDNIMSSYGDVEIELHPGCYWFDKVQIKDAKYEADLKSFTDKKAAWCARYGCD